VKAHARRAGLDPKLFAGHSLRSGFLTSAAARGASIFKMADQSRHKSMDTPRGYVRDAEIFNAWDALEDMMATRHWRRRRGGRRGDRLKTLPASHDFGHTK
jgi:hypothetical protein